MEIFINAEFGDDIPDFNVIEGGLEMCPRPTNLFAFDTVTYYSDVSLP